MRRISRCTTTALGAVLMMAVDQALAMLQRR